MLELNKSKDSDQTKQNAEIKSETFRGKPNEIPWLWVVVLEPKSCLFPFLSSSSPNKMPNLKLPKYP